jgi:hypothetical protein
MTYFRFSSEHDTHDNYTNNVNFNAENLFDVVENFKLFLRGVGYSFHDIELHLDDPEVIHEYNRKKFLDPKDEAFNQILNQKIA